MKSASVDATVHAAVSECAAGGACLVAAAPGHHFPAGIGRWC